MSRVIARSILRSAAAAGVSSVLVLGLVSGAAQAKDPKPTPNPFTVSCKFTGTFYPPDGPYVLSTALGDCKGGLGIMNHTGVLVVGSPDINGCAEVNSVEVSTPGTEMIMFNQKGDSLGYSLTGTQCLADAFGGPVTSANFCGGNPGDPAQSFVTANLEFTSGTGKLDGYSGIGALIGTVNHCATAFPFGNSFTGSVTGTVGHP